MSDDSRTLLGDRYALDQVIGRGGMAEVWKAHDVRLGREVAVKRLRVDLATDPTFQARFRREAQSAAGLNHPNIVATYDTGEEVDEKTGLHVPYIVMELVEGHTLRDLLRQDRRIRPELALEFAQGVLDALAYSHKAGIIHRDIKPANVMITPSGRVKVMDFGIARAVADTSATMTQTAAVIGTAQYLSPEQARGEQVDNRSDVYAAGCLLYELLVGRPPFIGDSPVSVAYQHVRETPTPPSHLDPELTPAMDAVVLKSLAKSPSDRYQDAKEMRDDISRLLAGEPVLAAPVVPPMTVAEPTAVTQVAPAAGAAAAASIGAASANQTNLDTLPPDTLPPDTLAGQTGSLQAVDEKRRNPILWVVLALAGLLAVIGLGVAVYLNSGNGTNDLIPVRSYVGFTETQATNMLESDGFKVASEHVTGADDSTVGTVTKQDPNAGELASGSTVTITVNDGPKTSKVPKGIIGATEAEAKKLLVDAGFDEDKITFTEATAAQENAHLDFEAGQVVAVNPAEAADVPATQKFTLALATGKSSVPNLLGLTQEQAAQKAKSAGFELEVSDTRVPGAADSVDKVAKQSPNGDEVVERTQKITVSLGSLQPTAATSTAQPTQTTPATVTLPDTVGQTQGAAVAAIADAGFTSDVVVLTRDVTDETQNGLVVEQAPATGRYSTDQVITIYVGRYTAPATSAPATPSRASAPASSAATSTPS